MGCGGLALVSGGKGEITDGYSQVVREAGKAGGIELAAPGLGEFCGAVQELA